MGMRVPIASPGRRAWGGRLVVAGFGAVLLVTASTGVRAREGAVNCMARIIADVAADEAPEQIKSKTNGEFGPITQIKVDKTTGKMSYCAARSYCYSSNAFEIVTPCRLKRDTTITAQPYFSYFTR